MCVSMAQQMIHQGYRVEFRQVCHQQDAQLQRTLEIFDRYNTSIKDANISASM